MSWYNAGNTGSQKSELIGLVNLQAPDSMRDLVFKNVVGAGEMAKQVKVLAVTADHLDSFS